MRKFLGETNERVLKYSNHIDEVSSKMNSCLKSNDLQGLKI